jgi:hypothetical protein
MKIAGLIRLTGRGLIAASLLAGCGVAAVAESPTGQPSTNIPGVSVVAAPPSGYDPVTATPLANAQLALPPTPNALAAPGAHAAWQNAVTAAQNREPPALTSTNIFNGPIQGKRSPSTKPPAQ